MKKNVALILTAVFLFSSFVSKADEGMWFLAFINKNYSEMQAKGFKLTVEDIYSINNSSMKDAVVALDHGSCTAELISAQGLLLTNHHCGYGEIQSHSSVENDYLTDGFWAMSMEEELPNPGKTASFLIRMEDVTERVLTEVNNGMKEKMRESVVTEISKKIEAEAIEGTHYEAEVQSFFGGNEYYLFIYEVHKDIRLVGAPPESIGKYGHDTDNWMWPRHTGDFSIFRVYCAPDGSPAEYSVDNVPYEPKHFFPLSIKGVKENDFAMIMGYPGTTNRYLTSWEVQQTIDHENDIRIEVRTKKLDIMRKHMKSDEKIRIQYASKHAQAANYWKYSKGQNLGLKKLKVVKRKKKMQKKLAKWIKKDDKRKEKYYEALATVDKAVKDNSEYDLVSAYWFEALYLGSELEQFALQNFGLYSAFGDEETLKETCDGLKEEGETFFKDYNATVDRELLIAMFEIYKDKVPKEFHPTIFEDIKKDFGGDFNKFADDLYSKSILTDEKRYMEFLENPTSSVFQNDLGVQTASSIIKVYWSVKEEMENAEYEQTKGRRLFIASYLEMLLEDDANALFYPDANSTMRLTYGQIGGYTANGKTYNYTTNLDGYMKKEDPNNDEFFVSARLKELYKAKDYGRYADENGKLITCFTTNNDITGGNSGSPVINGNGELIGVAFDGNWEAMSGDIAFETELQKTICVDIRFVLFVVDKYAGASNLIKEMKIVE